MYSFLCLAMLLSIILILCSISLKTSRVAYLMDVKCYVDGLFFFFLVKALLRSTLYTYIQVTQPFKFYNSMVYSVFTECATIITINARIFLLHHAQKTYLLVFNPISPALHPQATINLLSLQTCLLDISYKQNHILNDLLSMASFIQHVFEVYSCCNVYQYFTPF